AQERYNQRLRDAAVLGVSADGAMRELNLAVLSIARQSDLTAGQLADVAGRFPGLASATGAVVQAAEPPRLAADAQTALSQASGELRAAYDAERHALQSTIDRLGQFRRSIEDFRSSLLFDQSLSPLSPLQRLLEASGQFQSISTAALGGDATAQ